MGHHVCVFRKIIWAAARSWVERERGWGLGPSLCYHSCEVPQDRRPNVVGAFDPKVLVWPLMTSTAALLCTWSTNRVLGVFGGHQNQAQWLPHVCLWNGGWELCRPKAPGDVAGGEGREGSLHCCNSFG